MTFFDANTTGYRLVAGEGDGIPGLVVDVYAQTAVIKLDGGGPEAFYDPAAIAAWLGNRLQLASVVYRPRGRGAGQGSSFGIRPGMSTLNHRPKPVDFLENGLRFSADVYRGQKTGFFLDQRDNRDLIHKLARQSSVLNLFSFNGGFSVAAGAGGSDHVTSVDIAAPAVQAAEQHWLQNELPVGKHEAIVADCFEFLESAVAERRQWNIVICDPPSFAPSEKAVPNAVAAYGRLSRIGGPRYNKRRSFGTGILLEPHRSFELPANQRRGTGRARRKANVIADRGLPTDHPAPLAMPELRVSKVPSTATGLSVSCQLPSIQTNPLALSNVRINNMTGIQRLTLRLALPSSVAGLLELKLLYARFLGYEVSVFERSRVGHSLQRGGDSSLFATWRQLTSTLGLAALEALRDTVHHGFGSASQLYGI